MSADIASVFTGRASGPYDKGVRAQVIAVDQPVRYKGKDGQQKEALSSVISDGVEVVKVVCYDPQKFRFFKVNKTIMMRNIIKKTDEGRTIVVTSQSKAAFWTPLSREVPACHREEGQRLLFPPPADVLPISAALASPKKQKSSVRGRLVQEEESRTVKTGGEEVTIKNVTIEDPSGRARVTLWREAADIDVRPGDFVEITDVQVNLYQDTLSLSTTMRSRVQKIEAPETTNVVDVVGIAVNDGSADLFLGSEEMVNGPAEVTVPAEMLHEALFDGDAVFDLEGLCDNGPFKLKITMKGSEIVQVERAPTVEDASS